MLEHWRELPGAEAQAALVGHSVTMPITDGCLALADDQKVFLYEHWEPEEGYGRRQLVATIHGQLKAPAPDSQERRAPLPLPPSLSRVSARRSGKTPAWRRRPWRCRRTRKAHRALVEEWQAPEWDKP